MDRSDSPLNIDALRLQERGYRRQVDHEPLDTRARVDHAWCLFLLALHQAGRENLLASLQERGAVKEIPHENGFRLDRDATNLLRECLKQMCAVCELSRDPDDHADVERLRQLVTISGAESALLEADAEAARWLAEMAQTILTTPTVPRNRRYRRIPRSYS